MSQVIHLRNGSSQGDYDVLGPWCTENGIDPIWVPTDSDIYVLADRVIYEIYLHEADGTLVIVDKETVRKRVMSVICKPTPIPPLRFTEVEEMP